MGRSVAQKLIATHLVSGDMIPGQEIAIRIDQTLTQDATGMSAGSLTPSMARRTSSTAEPTTRYRWARNWPVNRPQGQSSGPPAGG